MLFHRTPALVVQGLEYLQDPGAGLNWVYNKVGIQSQTA